MKRFGVAAVGFGLLLASLIIAIWVRQPGIVPGDAALASSEAVTHQDAAVVPINSENAPHATEAPDGPTGEPPIRVSEPVVSSEERARSWLDTHSLPSGDVGIDHCIRALKDALDRPEQFRYPLAGLDSIVADREINPLGLEPSPADKKVLATLIAEYGERMNRLQRDLGLELIMANAAVAMSGDFERVPNEANVARDNLVEARAEQQRAGAALRSKFGATVAVTYMPGRDLSHCRALALTRANAAEYWAASDKVALDRAELSLALRTFFLERRR